MSILHEFNRTHLKFLRDDIRTAELRAFISSRKIHNDIGNLKTPLSISMFENLLSTGAFQKATGRTIFKIECAQYVIDYSKTYFGIEAVGPGTLNLLRAIPLTLSNNEQLTHDIIKSLCADVFFKELVQAVENSKTLHGNYAMPYMISKTHSLELFNSAITEKEIYTMSFVLALALECKREMDRLLEKLLYNDKYRFALHSGLAIYFSAVKTEIKGVQCFNVPITCTQVK